MNLPKYSRGFTIIELLISMSIIAIIAGGIIPTFSSYIRNQNLKQAQEQLKSDLRTVQNRALTGSLSNQTVSSDDDYIQYWGVRFVATSGSGTEMVSFVSTGTSCPPTYGTDSIEQDGFSLPNGAVYYITGGNCMFLILTTGIFWAISIILLG